MRLGISIELGFLSGFAIFFFSTRWFVVIDAITGSGLSKWDWAFFFELGFSSAFANLFF